MSVQRFSIGASNRLLRAVISLAEDDIPQGLAQAIRTYLGMGDHEWFIHSGWNCCKKCGVVKRADGKNKQCKGYAIVEVRGEGDSMSDEDGGDTVLPPFISTCRHVGEALRKGREDREAFERRRRRLVTTKRVRE